RAHWRALPIKSLIPVSRPLAKLNQRSSNPYILPIDLCIEATPVCVRSWHEFYSLEMSDEQRWCCRQNRATGMVEASRRGSTEVCSQSLPVQRWAAGKELPSWNVDRTPSSRDSYRHTDRGLDSRYR